MKRRTFLASILSLVAAPTSMLNAAPLPHSDMVMRSWVGDDGRIYRMPVTLPRYKGSGVCSWTKYAHSKEQDHG